MRLSDKIKLIGATDMRLIPGQAYPTVGFALYGKKYKLVRWTVGKQVAWKLLYGHAFRSNKQFSDENSLLDHLRSTAPLWTDDCRMPWGKHQGTLLSEVPDAYFLYLYEKQAMGNLYSYIMDNLDAIKANVQNQKQLYR